MASDTGAANDRLDERLAALRDEVLAEQEEVVVQEEGDQGQAIVLTDSRILVLKTGITATGTADGRIVGSFPISEITAVNVRKGPLGAVIQVCVDGREPPAPGSPPDNVIIFTGSQRMKKCEAIAARIESALGKPVGRTGSPEEAADVVPDQPAIQEAAVEPPDAPEPVVSDVAKGGRAPRSLAEEIFAELQESQAPAEQEPAMPARPQASRVVAGPPETTQPPEQPAPVPAVAAASNAPAEEPEPAPVLHRNPNLPKPVRVRRAGDRVLMLFGLLLAALVVGVAAMTPLRVAEDAPTIGVSWSELTSNPTLMRRQLNAVARYEVQARTVCETADRTMAAIESALKSGDRAAVAKSVSASVVDSAWRKMDAMKTPAGLAGAKQQLTSGLFVGKTAVANLSSGLQASTTLDSQEALARIGEARSLTRNGLATIAKMRTELDPKLK